MWRSCATRWMHRSPRRVPEPPVIGKQAPRSCSPLSRHGGTVRCSSVKATNERVGHAAVVDPGSARLRHAARTNRSACGCCGTAPSAVVTLGARSRVVIVAGCWCGCITAPFWDSSWICSRPEAAQRKSVKIVNAFFVRALPMPIVLARLFRYLLSGFLARNFVLLIASRRIL
jgi:hypothetical protein